MLSNEDIHKALKLFKLTLLAPPLYVSSLYPFKDTPPEILAHDIELMAHLKRLIRPNRRNPDPSDDEGASSEDDTSINVVVKNPTEAVHGVIVEYETGLGKSFIVTSRYTLLVYTTQLMMN